VSRHAPGGQPDHARAALGDEQHREEAATRWSRINADGSRVVIILRPARIAGREQVR